MFFPILIFIFPQLFTEWSEFYDQDFSSDENSQKYENSEYSQATRIVNTQQTSIWVQQCTFTECSTSYGGGAIFYSITGGKILLEFSSFNQCSTSNSGGGAIYDISGNSVINAVCFFNCFVTRTGVNGVFSFIRYNTKTFIVQSSFCSSNTDPSPSASIYITNGNSNLTSVNISHNIVYSYSAVQFVEVSSSIFSYCSINSNSADAYVCIGILINGLGTITSSNIINNQQEQTPGGTIYVSNTELTIEGCCILGNNENENRSLLYSYGSTGKITVENCSLPETFTISTNEGTIFLPSLPNQCFIHEFILTTTSDLCYGEKDKIEGFTCLTKVSDQTMMVNGFLDIDLWEIFKKKKTMPSLKSKPPSKSYKICISMFSGSLNITIDSQSVTIDKFHKHSQTNPSLLSFIGFSIVEILIEVICYITHFILFELRMNTLISIALESGKRLLIFQSIFFIFNFIKLVRYYPTHSTNNLD